MVDIGKKLKRARNKAGKSLREVEEETGISNSYLSLIENNHRDPSIKILQTLADYYGVDLTYFVASDKALESLSPEDKEFFKKTINDETRRDLMLESRGMSDEDLVKVIKIMRAFKNGELD